MTWLFFTLFALLTLVSALGVITVRRSVHAVFCLISAFINTAGLFILLGAEFLSMILVVVYVGAVTVLFLFVIMMLDTDKENKKKISGSQKWLGIGTGFFLMAELALLLALSFFSSSESFKTQDSHTITLVTVKDIGRVLYTDYFIPFQMGGFILLVAMFGAIVLTLHHREGVKRQDAQLQLQRTRKNAIEICSVPFYEGLETPNSLMQSAAEKGL
jgi:NADH-quinone oxidoreductase subunit J